MHCLEIIKGLNDRAVMKHLEHQNEMWQRGFEAGYERAVIEKGLRVHVTPSIIKRFTVLGQKTWKTITEEEKREYEQLKYILSAMVKHAWESR